MNTPIDNSDPNGQVADPSVNEDTSTQVDEQSGTTAVEQRQEDTSINQEAVNKRMNKLTFEKKSAQEAAERERNLRLDAERKLAEATKEVIPEIPEIPDFSDPDYETKLKQRDDILVKHAEENARRRADEALKEKQAEDAARKEQERFSQMETKYVSTAKALKLNDSEVQESSNIVGSYIPGRQNLAQHLMSDENGPLNVLYLSQNVEELEKVAAMNDIDAAIYINTVITPKATQLRPKSTEAPDPHYTPSGRSHSGAEDPLLKGCTFE